MADTHTLTPGDFGVIIRANGIIDLLVPPGQNHEEISPMHKCLLGAAIGVATDDNFRAHALQTLLTYECSDPGPDGGGH